MRVVVSALLVFALGVGLVPWAHADEPAPSGASGREAAARAFREGERAFAAGDFSGAAEAFERAYRAEAHPAPIWNAARSWHRAGELPRAASLYARYLREAKATAPDRDAAGEALAALAPRLGRLDVYAPDAAEVRIDDRLVEESTVYVYPGAHVISARVGGRVVRRTEEVEAGAARSVALLDAPSSAPASASAPGAGAASEAVPGTVSGAGSAPVSGSASAPVSTSVSGSGSAPVSGSTSVSGSKSVSASASDRVGRMAPPWGWGAVISGGVACLAVSGVTVWSGLDTLAARRDFDAAPTYEKLYDGRAKQLRTNVLLGASLGLGALTGAALTVLLVRRNPSAVRVAVTPPILGQPFGLAAGGVF